MEGLPQANWGKETAEEQQAKAASYKNIDYLTLNEGANSLRFIGGYIFRHMHYYEFGKRPHIICIGAEQCPVCKLGQSPAFYYYCNVLDRADEKMKIFRFGPGIKQRLDVIATKYGPLDGYDIEITRTGKKLDTKYPSILPEIMNPKPIPEATMAMVKSMYQDLNELYKLPTLADVQDAMMPKGSDDDKPAAQTPPPAASSTGATASHVQSGPVTQKDQPSGLQQGQKTILPLALGKAEKPCYGDEKVYSPQRPECTSCRLMHLGCKDRVLAFYTGEVMPA